MPLALEIGCQWHIYWGGVQQVAPAREFGLSPAETGMCARGLGEQIGFDSGHRVAGQSRQAKICHPGAQQAGAALWKELVQAGNR